LLRSGILNPAVNSLLSRVRHTNTLVIADRGFPSWPHLEIVDLALVDDIPTVLDVLQAVKGQWNFGAAFMADEFFAHNDAATVGRFTALLAPVGVQREPHPQFKQRVPLATGLIRTGDTTQYANMILESA
jgi:D-ribose pyranase